MYGVSDKHYFILNFSLFSLYRRSQTKVFTEVLVRLQRLGNSTKCTEWLPDLRGLGAGKLTRPLSSVSVYEFLEKQFKKPSSFDGSWTHMRIYISSLSVECRKITQFAASFSRMHRLWNLNSSDWLSTMPHYSMASHTCRYTPEENKTSQWSQIFIETNMCWTRK